MRISVWVRREGHSGQESWFQSFVVNWVESQDWRQRVQVLGGWVQVEVGGWRGKWWRGRVEVQIGHCFFGEWEDVVRREVEELLGEVLL